MRDTLMELLMELLHDSEVDRVIEEAEREIRMMTKEKRRELFGSEELPPDPLDLVVKLAQKPEEVLFPFPL